MTAGPTPPEPVDPPSIDATIGAAIDLILEAVPDLASLTLAVDAAGAAQVSYSRREVRVVETSGNLTRKKT